MTNRIHLRLEGGFPVHRLEDIRAKKNPIDRLHAQISARERCEQNERLFDSEHAERSSDPTRAHRMDKARMRDRMSAAFGGGPFCPTAKLDPEPADPAA